jgi:hypothetical protein
MEGGGRRWNRPGVGIAQEASSSNVKRPPRDCGVNRGGENKIRGAHSGNKLIQ